jgi:hypothetical protein
MFILNIIKRLTNVGVLKKQETAIINRPIVAKNCLLSKAIMKHLVFQGCSGHKNHQSSAGPTRALGLSSSYNGAFTSARTWKMALCLAEKYKVEALVRPKKPSKVMVIEYG